MQKYKLKYLRNLEISLIISLLLLILLFYNFPSLYYRISEPLDYHPPVIVVIEIPQTRQIIRTSRPRPILPSIPVPSDEIEIMDEVEIDPDKININSYDGLDINISNVHQLSSVPRQILEVLPERVDKNIKGVIILLLKIGSDGRVKDYKVIKNTTNSLVCLENVVRAAHKSRWKPVAGENKEYWIEKSYKFD